MKGWLMMSRVRGCVYNRLLVGSCAACGELLVTGSPAAKEEATPAPGWMPKLEEKMNR